MKKIILVSLGLLLIIMFSLGLWLVKHKEKAALKEADDSSVVIESYAKELTVREKEMDKAISFIGDHLPGPTSRVEIPYEYEEDEVSIDNKGFAVLLNSLIYSDINKFASLISLEMAKEYFYDSNGYPTMTDDKFVELIDGFKKNSEIKTLKTVKTSDSSYDVSIILSNGTEGNKVNVNIKEDEDSSGVQYYVLEFDLLKMLAPTKQ